MGIMTGLTPDIDVKKRAVTSFRSGILGCSSSSKECYQVKVQRTPDSGSGPATANQSPTGNGWRVKYFWRGCVIMIGGMTEGFTKVIDS